MTMTTPATISPEIGTFCKSLVLGSDPVFVEYVAHEGAVANNCFDNVSQLISRKGHANTIIIRAPFDGDLSVFLFTKIELKT